MKTVLIVEDDDIVREVLVEAVEKFGHKPYEATNGAKALEILRENHRMIDIAVLDVQMPVMNGADTCVIIKDMYPHIEIIISTAFIEGDVYRRLKHIGIKHILYKPYSLSELREIIDNHPTRYYKISDEEMW